MGGSSAGTGRDPTAHDLRRRLWVVSRASTNQLTLIKLHLWHLYLLPAVQLVHLHLQPVIFELEELYLAPQVINYLLFGVELYHWLVLDVHGSTCVVQCREGLFGVDGGRTHAGDHQRLRCPTETVHEEHG